MSVVKNRLKAYRSILIVVMAGNGLGGGAVAFAEGAFWSQSWRQFQNQLRPAFGSIEGKPPVDTTPQPTPKGGYDPLTENLEGVQ